MNKEYPEVIIDDVDVWCMQTIGVKHVEEIVLKLEHRVGSLKGRKCYGVLFGSPKDGLYRSCVSIKTEDDFKDLDRWVIPGGRYARTKIKDWENDIGIIGKTFSQMLKSCLTDDTRPSIEFYRSLKEVILLLPIR